MLINTKVLNIPPFISVQWNQIEYLTTENHLLIVSLKSGKNVQIPELPPELLEQIFTAHAAYLETESTTPSATQPPPQFGSNDVKIGFSTMQPNGLGIPLQHLDELRESPDLPPEVLDKVRMVSKLIPPEDIKQSAKPVENCNCPFCQISSAIHKDTEQLQAEENAIPEEIIPDEELKFEEWTIEQKGDKLYEVKNKLDTHESYNVFLGTPVGCTCGKSGCEHILAVLKS